MRGHSSELTPLQLWRSGRPPTRSSHLDRMGTDSGVRLNENAAEPVLSPSTMHSQELPNGNPAVARHWRAGSAVTGDSARGFY